MKTFLWNVLAMHIMRHTHMWAPHGESSRGLVDLISTGFYLISIVCLAGQTVSEILHMLARGRCLVKRNAAVYICLILRIVLQRFLGFWHEPTNDFKHELAQLPDV